MKVLFFLSIIIASTLAGPKLGFRSPVSGRIIGGRDALPGEFPYQISYQWGILGIFQHICGGSIVSPTWIVTAGHCVTEAPQFGSFKIIAGINSLSADKGQEINVIQKVVNLNYKGGVGPNDIALLKLEKPLTFNDKVQPISLPSVDGNLDGIVVLSGWGAINEIIPSLPIMPDGLQTAELPIIQIDDCKAALDKLLDGSESNPLDLISNICTGPLDGGYSACSGDSGGPLVQNSKLVGVVSWGMIPCGAVGAPSVYTNVAAFLDFIQDNVNDLPQSVL